MVTPRAQGCGARSVAPSRSFHSPEPAMTHPGSGSSASPAGPTGAAPAERTVVRLPSGRTLDLARSRWAGTLDREELSYCRAHGIALAYDCAQIGWVPETCTDDSPVVVAGGRAVDLAAYLSPEQDARRLRDTIAANIARIRDGEPDVAPAAEAMARLRAAIAARVADFHARHGVEAANRCHLVLHALLAPADAPRREAPNPGDGFTFRLWSAADAPRYRAMLDNPRLWEYLPEDYPEQLTDELALTLIELGRTDDRQEAVAVVRHGEAVGQCLLRFHEPFAGMRVAEVAYWLAEEHWGKGWMSRILPAFAARSFAHHDLDAIEAWIREDHAASARVAERSGFARDTFPFEAELAATLSRPRALRYVAYRGKPD